MPEYLMTIADMPRRRITKLSEIMTEARYMASLDLKDQALYFWHAIALR